MCSNERDGALRSPQRSWTTERLWQAYLELDDSRVSGSGQRTLADVVSLVRYAIGSADEFGSLADVVRERFAAWLAMQESSGRSFPEELNGALNGVALHPRACLNTRKREER